MKCMYGNFSLTVFGQLLILFIGSMSVAVAADSDTTPTTLQKTLYSALILLSPWLILVIGMAIGIFLTKILTLIFLVIECLYHILWVLVFPASYEIKFKGRDPIELIGNDYEPFDGSNVSKFLRFLLRIRMPRN